MKACWLVHELLKTRWFILFFLGGGGVGGGYFFREIHEKTHEHESLFSLLPWQFLHFANKGFKSGMMLPSSQSKDFALALFFKSHCCWNIEPEEESANCVLCIASPFQIPGSWYLGFIPTSAEDLATFQQQILQLTWVAFARSVWFARSC